MPWVKLARLGGRLSASPRGQPAGECGAPQPKRYGAWRACARDTRHWSRTRGDSSLLAARTHVLGEKAIPQRGVPLRLRGGAARSCRACEARPADTRREAASPSHGRTGLAPLNNLARRTRVKLVRLRADRCGWPVCGEPFLPGGGRTWGERAKHRARPSGSRDAYR